MKNINKFILFIIVLINCYQFSTITLTKADELVKAPTVTPTMSYTDIAKKVSLEYNQDWWLIYNICKAESHFNPNAIHDGGAGKGICGIHKTTFIYWEKKFNIDLNYNSDYDQIKMTALAFSNGELYRSQFSTYNRYKEYGVFNKYEVK
jgi:hypothetical protein